ncbi:MAG: hypothetical protein AMJ69_11375 [Gammaproteobacteria bacterium SG8_47]|nr:MAG: hypothetical protein AMJ69_11375 [Gammaproteobacteria bacterium SG8_47]
MNFQPLSLPTYQRGTTLIVGLMILVSVTLLAVMGIQSGIVQLQLSNVEEINVDSFERAQSVVDAVIEDTSNFIVSSDTGDTNCTADHPDGCDEENVTLNGTFFANNVAAKVERLHPDRAPMPRGTETSIDKFDAVLFGITGTYDNADSGQGKAEVAQGVLLLIPKGAQ